MREGVFAAIAAVMLAWAGHAAAVPPGQTIDFGPEKGETDARVRAWRGRAYLHPKVLEKASEPHPVLVFLHGLNRDKVPFRWMGARGDRDVREMVGKLMDEGVVAPLVLVAPYVTRECETPRTMWPEFDLDRFLGLAVRNVEPKARMDRGRVVLSGHSGAGCNTHGGLVTGLRASSIELLGVLVMDTCMDEVEGPLFALARPRTDVVITYQPEGWERPFEEFERRFKATAATRGARGLRVVDRLEVKGPHHHEAMVEPSLRKWLPRWFRAPEKVSGAVRSGG